MFGYLIPQPLAGKRFHLRPAIKIAGQIYECCINSRERAEHEMASCGASALMCGGYTRNSTSGGTAFIEDSTGSIECWWLTPLPVPRWDAATFALQPALSASFAPQPAPSPRFGHTLTHQRRHPGPSSESSSAAAAPPSPCSAAAGGSGGLPPWAPPPACKTPGARLYILTSFII
jgi:hypothetical protein